jgi:hypothetical protein
MSFDQGMALAGDYRVDKLANCGGFVVPMATRSTV